MSDHIILAVNEKTGIATIEFNQPHIKNSLTIEDYKLLAHYLKKVDKMEAVVCTVLISTGDFFSAGANVKAVRPEPAKDEILGESVYLRRLSEGNLILAKSFYDHTKVLVCALNGPVVGMLAGLIGHCDFIYAVPSAYLLTPFTSIGVVCEGGASLSFPQKMGPSIANRCLLLGEKLNSEVLFSCGFISKVFPQTDCVTFNASVIDFLAERFSDLDHEAVIISKALIKASLPSPESSNIGELFAAMDRFNSGRPQVQFKRLAAKEKRHKL